MQVKVNELSLHISVFYFWKKQHANEGAKTQESLQRERVVKRRLRQPLRA